MVTVEGLRKEYKKNFPDGHFFDPGALSFFGEHMSEMRVLKKTKQVDGHECYVLSTVQHNFPDGRRIQHYYFDKETFKYIGAEEE